MKSLPARLKPPSIPLLAVAAMLSASPAAADVDLVKVHKSERKMYLLDQQKVVRVFDIALGGSPKGHKVQEGDQKTPEGTYLLDYIKYDSSYYKSMHISYPNEQDKANAEKLGVPPGGLIMIHGQPNKLGWLSMLTQHFDWTDGCIALTNREMDEFLGMVRVGTPIEIRWD